MGTKRSLRIALVADPFLPVPPPLYGGIERILAFLAEGLQGRGHEVTIWCHRDSSVGVRRRPYGAGSEAKGLTAREAIRQVGLEIRKTEQRFDVVHSFGRLVGLLPILRSRLAVVQSYQRDITRRSIRWAVLLSGGRTLFTSCSTAQRRSVNGLGRWETVYNGARAAAYRWTSRVAQDAPLLFLGRLERIKGPHTAIRVARRAGRRLVLAGNVPGGEEQERFYQTEVLPLVDGECVTYVGPVDDERKNELLGSSAALLMPLEWEEPFGIVMAEALACGTPVVALRRGSVPEVVEDGKTGFVCDTEYDMARAVTKLEALSRTDCRSAFESRFSDSVITDAYERLYYREISLQAAP